MGSDFNDHIEDTADACSMMHGGFGYGERNSTCVAIQDFAVAFNLIIVNSLFKEDHLVTFRSGNSKTQIDYFLMRAN